MGLKPEDFSRKRSGRGDSHYRHDHGRLRGSGWNIVVSSHTLIKLTCFKGAKIAFTLPQREGSQLFQVDNKLEASRY